MSVDLSKLAEVAASVASTRRDFGMVNKTSEDDSQINGAVGASIVKADFDAENDNVFNDAIVEFLGKESVEFDFSKAKAALQGAGQGAVDRVMKSDLFGKAREALGYGGGGIRNALSNPAVKNVLYPALGGAALSTGAGLLASRAMPEEQREYHPFRDAAVGAVLGGSAGGLYNMMNKEVPPAPQLPLNQLKFPFNAVNVPKPLGPAMGGGPSASPGPPPMSPSTGTPDLMP